jgi:NADH-quinone oxidoreductase subunit J
MTVTTALFYIFAAILVFAALRVVTARNPVHAALWLVLAFFTAAAHWLMLRAEFLAIVLVLVYVGAVMVLFLFVVMMLDVNFDVLRKEFRSYLLVAIIAAIVLTHRERRTSRHQDPGLQVKVRAKDRLRVLSMPPEKKES